MLEISKNVIILIERSLYFIEFSVFFFELGLKGYLFNNIISMLFEIGEVFMSIFW